MTGRDVVLQAVTEPGVAAILRAGDARFFPQAAAALVSGGIRAIEVTLTTPGAISAITRMATDAPEAVVGAGTVLTADEARAVLGAGSRFIVSPVFAPEVCRIAKEAGAVCIPGALTPAEIFNAWQAGADLVKVFPAGLFGPRYLRYLRELFPHIPLFPTGGLDLDNASEYITAGAAAVGLGGNLADAHALTTGKVEPLAERARTLVSKIEEARRE